MRGFGFAPNPYWEFRNMGGAVPVEPDYMTGGFPSDWNTPSSLDPSAWGAPRIETINPNMPPVIIDEGGAWGMPKPSPMPVPVPVEPVPPLAVDPGLPSNAGGISTGAWILIGAAVALFLLTKR